MARAVPHSPGCASPLSEWHSGGGLPVVLAAPHGGDTLPPHLPDRTQGCHCPDAGTRELALALHEEFAQQARGLQPHLVLSRLHRRKLDPNRPRSLAAESEAARSCWDGYHQLLRTALDDAIRTHGFALLLDIHGQDHRPGVTELGYAVSALALLRDDAELDGAACTSAAAEPPSSIEALLLRNGRHGDGVGTTTLSGLLRGDGSMGALLERRGVACTPSPTRPQPVSAAALGQTLAQALHMAAADHAAGGGRSVDGRQGVAGARQLVPLLLEHGAAVSEAAAVAMAHELWPHVEGWRQQQAGGGGGGEGAAGGGISHAGVYFGGAYTVQHYSGSADPRARGGGAGGGAAAVAAAGVVAIQVEVAAAGRCVLFGGRSD
jgi:hypothetical protein